MKFNTGSIALLLSFVFKVYSKGYRCSYHFVVHEGDTCTDATTGLDPLHTTRVKYILQLNPMIDCDHLKEGDKICTEDYELDFSNGKEVGTYIIQKSDTYQGIAKKLGTTVEILGNLNPTEFQYRLGDENIKNQVGNEIIYRKDGDYLPNFDNSEEYILPKHGNTNTLTIPTTTTTTTKKSSTKKTSTKKTTTKKSSTKKSNTKKSSTKKSSTKKSSTKKSSTKKSSTKKYSTKKFSTKKSSTKKTSTKKSSIKKMYHQNYYED